jgi:beta-galactosidase
LVGVPHYPEQVDRSYWERDAERMAAAGFNTVRMGEFAWHILEPREGVFDFSLFDDAIELLGRHGISTMLCTPTATPPRWLTVHYPEVLRVDVNGRAMSHGSRQHADTSSPVFRVHSQRITRAMAEHYVANLNVIGWQIDNELNTSGGLSYSAATRREFQKFLEEAYGSIDRLNFAWGGDFWATAYANFDQIVLPLDQSPVSPSPGHRQDYHRFLAASTACFQQEQVDILRATNSEWLIYHNLGRLDDVDLRGAFSADLDFVGFDVYPLLFDESQRTGGHGYAQAQHLDLCRGFTGNFIVPEQQVGVGSQPTFATMNPEPGEMRRMAYSSVARGADGIMFFRWRPAHFGAEIYWMGIIDHDDVPRRKYAEAKQFATEITAIKDKILGTHVRMDVGIAAGDFDNQEAHRSYPMGLPSPYDDATIMHRYCYRRGIACGFIHPEDNLDLLKVLYVPHWTIWKDEWTSRVEAFAHKGGTVMLSARTGSRDTHNHVIRTQCPGPTLAVLAGVKVDEFGLLAGVDDEGLFRPSTGATVSGRHRYPAESASRRYHLKLGNHELTAAHMYELLSASEGTDVLAYWSDRFAAGRAAMTSREVGAGRVLYLGTYLTEELMPALFRVVLDGAGVAPLVPDLPAGVEVAMRETAERKLLFLLNTTDRFTTVNHVPSGTELLSSQVVGGRVHLDAYHCAVIEMTDLGA